MKNPPTRDEITSGPMTPSIKKDIDIICKEKGPIKASKECKELQKQMSFACCTLLGKPLCAHVTCRQDIGFAIAMMAELRTQLSKIHCKCLKGITTCLQRTCMWGIRCKLKPSFGLPSINLADGDFGDPSMPLPKELLPFLSLLDNPTIVCFVDAACADVKPKRKSTTGGATLLAGSVAVHQSKMQTQTVLSSTEAKFNVAASAAKMVQCLRFTLACLRFTQEIKPRITHEDDQLTQKTADAIAPTEQTQHTSTQRFAIMDWKADRSIEMSHMPDELNPGDLLLKPPGWVPCN